MDYIAYYRVSTAMQGADGLGMAAQRADVARFLHGALPVATYEEVESSKSHTNRPELLKAIDHCKRIGATLLVAKLDRLSRDLLFITQLMQSKVLFKCCDMPEADSFTIHIFGAMAQKEREMISDRTKRALAAKKEQGFTLGNPKMQDKRYAKALSKRMHAAKRAADKPAVNKSIAFIISELKAKGASLADIAAEINRQGFKTTRGCAFSPVQVFRLIKSGQIYTG